MMIVMELSAVSMKALLSFSIPFEHVFFDKGKRRNDDNDLSGGF